MHGGLSAPALRGLLIVFSPIVIQIGLRRLLGDRPWRYAMTSALVAPGIELAWFGAARLYYRPTYEGSWTWVTVIVFAFLYIPVAEWAAVFATLGFAAIDALQRRRRWTRATTLAVSGSSGAVVGAVFAPSVVLVIFGFVSVEMAPLMMVLAIVGACCGAACGLLLPFFLPAVQSIG
jgi:hypothetical protein